MESETIYVVPHPEALLIVKEVESVVVIEEPLQFIEIGAPGPQGIRGPVGPVGPQGPSGNADPFYYRHDQGVPSSTWTVTHDLGAEPNVDVFDTTGRRVEGSVQHTSPSHTTITFNAAFSGVAVFS